MNVAIVLLGSGDLHSEFLQDVCLESTIAYQAQSYQCVPSWDAKAASENTFKVRYIYLASRLAQLKSIAVVCEEDKTLRG